MNPGFPDPLQPLRPLRIGCVSYLNSRPLIEPYLEAHPGPVLFDHPSALATALAAKQLDAALIPAYEALRMPEYALADGVAIASCGPVWSVILAHRVPLAEIRKISLDPASRTSAHLCKLLFAEWGGPPPEYSVAPSPYTFPAPQDNPTHAHVLIGNQAIAFRQQLQEETAKSEKNPFQILDLGEAWHAHTGQPFVFALWTIAPWVAEPQKVAAAFREIAQRGRAQIEVIAARQRHHSPDFVRHYLQEFIHFDLGPEKKAGLTSFRCLLQKHSLLDNNKGAHDKEGELLRFV